jgi:hypothetical protein
MEFDVSPDEWVIGHLAWRFDFGGARALPCTRAPAKWDADASPHDAAQTADACENHCPAYEQCLAWALSDDCPATGIVAGLYITERPGRRWTA